MVNILLLIMSFFVSKTHALEGEVDVVLMKNGDVFRGRIIEQDFGKYIQIKFNDGNEKRLVWSKVKNVKKENSSADKSTEDTADDDAELKALDAASRSANTGTSEPSMRDSELPRAVNLSPRTRIFGGLTLSTATTTSTITDWSMGTGFHAGIGIEFPVTSGVSLMAGVEYMSRSLEASIDLGSTSLNAKISIGYLIIPVLSRVNVGAFSIGIGPYVGLALSAKGEVGGNTTDILDEVSSLDFGARAYSTLDFGEPGNAFLGVGYDFGFSNINDSGSIEEENRALFFDLGFRF